VKIKLDECMARRVISALAASGHDVATAQQEGLAGSEDTVVLNHAVRESRLLITLDRDLADVRHYPPGSHHGVVLLRLADQRSDLQITALEWLRSRHQFEELVGCTVVVQNDAVRIRRPGEGA
jgi:predicted nuclease of predicted toxin-antitoxin system